MRVANAPCSWGVLEFEATAQAPTAARVLDEIAATGYEGTELGAWGFLGTDPSRLSADLNRRRLALAGAFVAVALTDPAAHVDGVERAVRTARLLADTGGQQPLIVLSDATASVPARTRKAGRITAADMLTPRQWDIVAAGAERIAAAVHGAAGLRTAFHPHCATYVETPEEIDALMRRTPRDRLGLCLDTGHATYGGGDPLAFLAQYADRIWHVHFKDCSSSVAVDARSHEWDYVTAIRHGLFCELGRGVVRFLSVLNQLRTMRYDGWIVVEQDVLPSMGTPGESAQRNREYLSRLGL